eukprot:COSAG02_NODE_2724_length_8156_cov_146.818791_1_plen_57_part_10
MYCQTEVVSERRSLNRIFFFPKAHRRSVRRKDLAEFVGSCISPVIFTVILSIFVDFS